MGDIIQRAVPFELRASSDGRTLSGYAAVFNSPTRIFERNREFDEQIAPGAFARTINARDRVVLQFDHGQHPLIGGMPLGKITDLREDDHGLFVEARLSEHALADIVAVAIADEAIDGMSFRFSVPEGGDIVDRSGDMPLRTINELKLYELGPVTFPAYDTTSVGVRSVMSLLSDAQRRNVIDQFSPTADEAPEEEETVTPDEGSRLTRNQRQALIHPHLTKENPHG